MTPGPQKQFDQEHALERAMHVFWQQGYTGASLSQLMCEMGIGKKSLYDTFGNKRQLFLKALDLYASQSLRNVKEKLNKPGPALQNLREFFRASKSQECKGCFYGTNMADFDISDEEVAGRFCGHMKDFEEAIEEALIRAKEQGELVSRVCPKKVSRLLSCLGQGTGLVDRVGQCSSRQNDAIEIVFELLEK